jgi:hypothetical protein
MNNQNNMFSNINEEEEFNNSANLIDLLLYSSMGIRDINNNYRNDNINFFNLTDPQENIVYTRNIYRFDEPVSTTTSYSTTTPASTTTSYSTTTPASTTTSYSTRNRLISPLSILSASNYILEETMNAVYDTYDIYFGNNIYDNAINRLFEENRERDLQRREDEYINFSSQRYDTLNFENIKEQKDCSICLTDFEKENMVSVTLCKHVFHHDCIKEWTHYKSNCPVCREELKK